MITLHLKMGTLRIGIGVFVCCTDFIISTITFIVLSSYRNKPLNHFLVFIGFVGNLNQLHVSKSQKWIGEKYYVFRWEKISEFMCIRLVIMRTITIQAINEELFLNQICIIYCSFSSRAVRIYVLRVPKFQNFNPSHLKIFFSFFVFSSAL